MGVFGVWHHLVGRFISENEEREIRRDDIYNREPLSESWGMGYVISLGDAAHPMTPRCWAGA